MDKTTGLNVRGGKEFKYTGKRPDPIVLYYYGARYYARNSERTTLIVLASTPITRETAETSS